MSSDKASRDSVSIQKRIAVENRPSTDQKSCCSSADSDMLFMERPALNRAATKRESMVLPTLRTGYDDDLGSGMVDKRRSLVPMSSVILIEKEVPTLGRLGTIVNKLREQRVLAAEGEGGDGVEKSPAAESPIADSGLEHVVDMEGSGKEGTLRRSHSSRQIQPDDRPKSRSSSSGLEARRDGTSEGERQVKGVEGTLRRSQSSLRTNSVRRPRSPSPSSIIDLRRDSGSDGELSASSVIDLRRDSGSEADEESSLECTSNSTPQSVVQSAGNTSNGPRSDPSHQSTNDDMSGGKPNTLERGRSRRLFSEDRTAEKIRSLSRRRSASRQDQPSLSRGLSRHSSRRKPGRSRSAHHEDSSSEDPALSKPFRRPRMKRSDTAISDRAGHASVGRSMRVVKSLGDLKIDVDRNTAGRASVRRPGRRGSKAGYKPLSSTCSSDNRPDSRDFGQGNQESSQPSPTTPPPDVCLPPISSCTHSRKDSGKSITHHSSAPHLRAQKPVDSDDENVPLSATFSRLNEKDVSPPREAKSGKREEGIKDGGTEEKTEGGEVLPRHDAERTEHLPLQGRARSLVRRPEVGRRKSGVSVKRRQSERVGGAELKVVKKAQMARDGESDDNTPLGEMVPLAAEVAVAAAGEPSAQ
ncbi:hypothetical protein HK104_004048 [Borealophlyctis nickersoniae]|nr:hypothetical protein HK104_004048 [Borealophlyctis nickersoniae]